MGYLFRWVCVLVFVGKASLLAADARPSAKPLLALEGPALFKAANETSLFDDPYTTDELITVAGKMADELKRLPPDNENRYAFDTFFEEACGKASDLQLDRLIQVYLRLEPGSFEKENVLPAIAGGWIHREVRALRNEHVQLKLAKQDIAPPKDLKDAPKNLVTAWQLYQQAMQAYENAFPRESIEKPVSFQANNRAFFGLVDEILVGRGKNHVERILRFGWGATCGMGADSLGDPQSLAVFMSLLRQRRLAEAVGASLLVSTDKPVVVGGGAVDVRIEFLETCGLDWEGILAGEETKREYSESYFSFHDPILAELAGYGSERAARLLAELAQHVKPDRKAAYAYALAALVEYNPSKPADCDNYSNMANTLTSDQIDRVSKVSIPPAVQKELIGIVQSFASPQSETQLARAVLTMLARARDRTTIPALHSLLAHPSADVSRDAAAILCAMGEKVEPHEIANTNPVIFKILVNGKPLPLGFKVDWQVDRESGYVSDVVEADMHGAVAIPREQFLDPQKRPTGVALNSTVLDPADRFWFDVHLPVPRDLDVVSNVEVKVFAVHLSLGNLSKLNRPSGTKVAVQIRKKLNGETSRTSYPESEPRKFEAAVKGPVVLPLLQSGTYLLEIEMLGAARWSQAVELSPANPEITASLQPGSDVHFNVSGTAEDKVFATSTLLKDGNEFETSFDDKSRTYKSLPCGNYVLHIPSSDEIRENSMMESYQAGPDEVAYLGRDVAFTISEGSSATIDLGEIHLEAPAK